MVAEPSRDSGVGPAPKSGAAEEIVGRMVRVPFTALHLRSCGLIGATSYFDSLDSLMLASALAIIVTSLHFSFVDVGFLLGAAFAGMTVGSLFFGWLAELIGRKPVIVWTVGLFGALSIAAAFAWDFQSLLVIRVIEGLALGGQMPVAASMYNEFLPGKERGRRFFYGFTVLFSLGILCAPLFGLGLVHVFGPNLGWRALFLLGGLALPLAIAAQFLLPESPRWLADKGRIRDADAIVARFEAEARAEGHVLPEATPYRAVQQSTSLVELFHGIYVPRTILTWTLFFATYFVNYGLQIWMPTLYVKVGGLPASAALGLAVVYGVASLGMTFVWGYLADIVGRKGGFVIGYSMAVIGVLIGIGLIQLGATAWPALLTVAVISGLGSSFCAASCYLYTPELFPTRMRAWATSTGSTVSRIGSFVAPTVIGALLAANLGITSVFILLGSVAACGLAAILVLAPETSRYVLEEVSA